MPETVTVEYGLLRNLVANSERGLKIKRVLGLRKMMRKKITKTRARDMPDDDDDDDHDEMNTKEIRAAVSRSDMRE